MYQVNVKAEDLIISDLDFIKSFLRVSNSVEDSLIQMFITTAVKHVETYCNNFITVKTVEITTNQSTVDLIGTVNEILSVKINGESTTEYEIYGNNVKSIILDAELTGNELVTVEYTTLSNISDSNMIFIAQKVAELYGRNEDKNVKPDYSLINDIKRIALC